MSLPAVFLFQDCFGCLSVPWGFIWFFKWTFIFLQKYKFFIFIFLLHFRYLDTCEEHVRLLHRYTRGSVTFCLPPLHLYLAFLTMLSLPNSPPHAVSPLFPPNRLQCVVLPSLCPCVLIVQHPLVSENMRCLIFCSWVSLLRMMVSRFIHVPTKDTNSLFLMAA